MGTFFFSHSAAMSTEGLRNAGFALGLYGSKPIIHMQLKVTLTIEK
jgi:hypothetical protein